MQKLTIFLVLLTCICCSNSTEKYSPSITTEYNVSDSITAKYFKILNGLQYEYVLHYRRSQQWKTDMKLWGMPKNDSIFKLDSINYWESYHSFFNQDRKFIEWLLTYKNDNKKSDLWQMYQDPASSYISECFFNWNNSRAAITLIQNFLDGTGFKCYECGYSDRRKCNKEQYEKIEKFLKTNKKADCNELRQAWKIKNAR